MNKSFKDLISLSIIPLFLSAVFALPVSASTTDGTIDSTNKYAWGENIGWINFGATNGNVHITDSGLSGYALSETVGWINLGNVVNDGEGNLSGQAWSENTGWIKFNPANGGVIINSSGEFVGSALSENIGWIIFGGDYKVKTDWRPQSARGCASWTYSDWSSCSNDQQIRTILSSTPSGCGGGSPILSQSCSSGGGGGLPAAAYNPPVIPKPTTDNSQGGFAVFINDNALQTNTRNVTLKFNAGADVKRMAISESPDFKYATQERYVPIKKWTLSGCNTPPIPSQEGNICTVYVKFFTQYGVASKIISDSIILKASIPQNENLIRTSNDYKVYIVKDNQKQWIKTSQEFNSLGYKWSDILLITPEQLSSYPDYPSVTDNSQNNLSPYSFSHNLKPGDRGADVKELQKLLNGKGFIVSLNGPGSLQNETEIFGYATRKALIKFQKANNIPATGYFGPITRKVVGGMIQ